MESPTKSQNLSNVLIGAKENLKDSSFMDWHHKVRLSKLSEVHDPFEVGYRDRFVVIRKVRLTVTKNYVSKTLILVDHLAPPN